MEPAIGIYGDNYSDKIMLVLDLGAVKIYPVVINHGEEKSGITPSHSNRKGRRTDSRTGLNKMEAPLVISQTHNALRESYAV